MIKIHDSPRGNFSMRVIGLMSGTSVDGIDAALVDLSGEMETLQIEFLAGQTYPYPSELRSQILSVCAGGPLAMAELAALDDAIATCFAEAAIAVQTGQPPANLIGSHGQTVYHRPPSDSLGYSLGYSLQLGRGELIAHLTKIPTVSNFRAADIALCGQGAPLVPPVDAALLRHPSLSRCIQNIGGIGNVTYLPAKSSATPEQILGWDTGPGNALIDLAVQQFSKGEQTYDQDGNWAAQGTICQPLVDQWLQHDYFHLPPPKSTGRELFGADYLPARLQECQARNLSPADSLATLTELTAAAIAHSYRRFLPALPDQLLLCGGGSRNSYLRRRLQQLLPTTQVCTTDEMGLNGDFKEAIAFAVLAYWHHQGIPGNLPAVTGAKQAVRLGEFHSAF
jgi:anhydro-N-acetylmuramic acid kinase